MEQIIFSVAGDLLSGVAFFLLGAAAQFIRDERKDRKAIENGVCALLRNNIILIHNEAITKGTIPATQYENVTKMNEAYHDLGGNGLVRKMMREINDLHTSTISRKT